MRRTLGTAVFGGMLGVTLFGIFLTPVFYYVIQWFADLHHGFQGRRRSATRPWMPKFVRSRGRARQPGQSDPLVVQNGQGHTHDHDPRHGPAGVETVSDIAGLDTAAAALADEDAASAKPR